MDLLKLFTDWNKVTVDYPVRDIQRFLDLLKVVFDTKRSAIEVGNQVSDFTRLHLVAYPPKSPNEPPEHSA